MNKQDSTMDNIIKLQSREPERDFILIKDCVLYVHGREAVSDEKYKTQEKPQAKVNSLFQTTPITYASGTIDFDLRGSELYDLLSRLKAPAGKTSFLVFKNQKYTTIQTDNIAFFYIRNDAVSAMCFDKQEFALNQSLDQITNSVSSLQFFRVNRKYLINFKAIKEVEHYFLRKLFVKLLVETTDKLLINKEKTNSFLRWMENR